MTRGIFLNIDQVHDQVVLNPECFKNISNIKFFIIHDSYEPSYFSVFPSNYEVNNKIQLPHGVHTLPSELRYLKWDGYSYHHLPSNFSPKNLLELIMSSSSLLQLWYGVQVWFVNKCFLMNVDSKVN